MKIFIPKVSSFRIKVYGEKQSILHFCIVKLENVFIFKYLKFILCPLMIWFLSLLENVGAIH